MTNTQHRPYTKFLAAFLAAAVLVTSAAGTVPGGDCPKALENRDSPKQREIATLGQSLFSQLAPSSRIEAAYKKLTGKSRVGKRVRALRNLDGLTTAEVAQAAGIKEARLAAIEEKDKKKKEFPTTDEIEQLARALEVLPEFLTKLWWDSFPTRMRRVLTDRVPQMIDPVPQGIRRSVMALVIRKRQDGYELLLTKRSRHKMKRLPGFWTPPGGSREPDSLSKDGLESISTAALRETREETHVSLLKENIFGRLDDCFTRDGAYLITPVIVLVPQGTEWHKTDEAEDGYWLPLEELSRPDIFQHLEMREKKIEIDGRTQIILMQFNEIVREANGTKKAQPTEGCIRWKVKDRSSWEKVFEKEYIVSHGNLAEILSDPLRLLFLPPNFHHPITRDEFNRRLNSMIEGAAKKNEKVVVRIRLNEEHVVAEVGADIFQFPLSMPKELPAMAFAGPLALSMRDISPSEMLLGCIISWFAVVMVAVFIPEIRAAFSYVKEKIASLGSLGLSPQGSAKPPRKGTVPTPAGEPSTLFLDAVRPALEKKGFSRIEFIGEGDRAYAYKALHNGRVVAIKIEKIPHKRRFKYRTALGIRVLRWILGEGHPNVMKIFGAGNMRINFRGRNRNVAYHVLEYVDGVTLSQAKYDGRFGKMGFHNALLVVIQILEGLQFIHSRGL